MARRRGHSPGQPKVINGQKALDRLEVRVRHEEKNKIMSVF